MSVEVARRQESSATMLILILKRNHKLCRRREQERFESHYKSNFISCEETILECLDWNKENPEEKVEFMIRTPDEWKSSFIRPTSGFCRINKVVLDQNIHIPLPEVDAISFVKYNLKHIDGLLTPWDLMNCKEMLYQVELYKRCDALIRQCLDWNRRNEKGLIQYAIKTPKIWNHEKIKARPKFKLVPYLEEITPIFQPHHQFDQYESCSRQNYDPIGQIEQTEIFNSSETLNYSIETLENDFDKTTRGRTRKQYESFDILLAPAKNPNAIPKMSSCHRVYRKPIPDEKVNAVESPATQTDALSDKRNVSFEIIFEEHTNYDAKPKLSSEKRNAKYGDFYYDSEQEKDYQTSVQHKNITKQIEGEERYQQAGTDIESVINPEDGCSYPQWTTRPLLPIAKASTPVEMGIVSGTDIETNTFLLSERNKQEASRFLDRKAIQYEPGRFRFSSLHRFSERPTRIPIMVANTYENRRIFFYSRVSRIPIRIKDYMWKSMAGKSSPALVQPFPGSLIPVTKTTFQGVYDPKNVFGHKDNGKTEQHKIAKFRGISREQMSKRPAAVSCIGPVDFYKNEQLQENVEKNAITTHYNKKRQQIHCENHIESKNVLNPRPFFPKPAQLPPIAKTSSSEKSVEQEKVSLSPPPTSFPTLPLVRTGSPRTPFDDTIESSSESTSRPASVTGYPKLPPIGGIGKPCLISASSKRRLPAVISRPVSAAGYAKLPPISTTKY